MKAHKYILDPEWIKIVAANFSEFANGATQVSIRTKDGKLFREILLSNSSAIVAMRGYKDLPFNLADIAELFQTDDDKNPKKRGDWYYWDEWR